MIKAQNRAVLQQRVENNGTSVIQNDFSHPKRIFNPLINERIEALNTVLVKDFALLNNCIWTTEWLNTWTIHQSVHTYTIVEVEDNACESVFYHLRNKGFKNVFLEPDALLMERYVSDAENPVIIQKLVGRSPLMSVKTDNGMVVKIPKLEKILVDVYCDNIVFFAYKGHEQDQIFQRVFKNYALDLKTFLAYAERRKRKVSLMQYLHLKNITLL
jgi:hypothetical protein